MKLILKNANGVEQISIDDRRLEALLYDVDVYAPTEAISLNRSELTERISIIDATAETTVLTPIEFDSPTVIRPAPKFAETTPFARPRRLRPAPLFHPAQSSAATTADKAPDFNAFRADRKPAIASLAQLTAVVAIVIATIAIVATM